MLRGFEHLRIAERNGPKIQPAQTLPTTVETWWEHNPNVMHAEVVVATGMVGLEEVTGHGCVLHGVKPAKLVANGTTLQMSANQRMKKVP